MSTNDSQLEAEAAGWLARLPFLGADELSFLLGVTRHQATGLLGKLKRLGWVEHVDTSSPELEPERLYALTQACLPALAQRLGLTEGELQGSLPVGRREAQERLARLETAIGFNHFAAELVAGARDDIEVELEDVRALPSRRRSGQTWWPPEVEGYGCLRWGQWHAPFFVAWDRAGSPPFHRRKRVAGWCAFRDTHHPWGREDIPPILVVCPGEAEAEQWSCALLAAYRGLAAPLPVFLTDVTSALGEGPLGPVWRRPDGSVRAHLCERLAWRPAVPSEVRGRVLANPAAELEPTSQSGQQLRDWAREAVASSEGSSRVPGGLERLAALSLVTSSTEKRMLEWLGPHPLLSVDDLAVILRISCELAQHLLDNLLRHGLVDFTDRSLENEASGQRRYFLTHVGLKLLATRDGVPPRRYARYGIVAAAMPGKQGGGRLQTLLRQLDHTVGVNRFFVRLIADGGKSGPRLVRWLSASEAAQRFTCGDVPHWLRPDGAGDVYWQGKVRRFYLEWDRGTMHWPQTLNKLHAHASYFECLRRNGPEDNLFPTVLIVTASPARERLIACSLGLVFNPADVGHILTSLKTLISSIGPWSQIWLPIEGGKRVSWPDLGGKRATTQVGHEGNRSRG